MRCVIGMDIHRTFAEVAVWEEGRLRHAGRVDMTRSVIANPLQIKAIAHAHVKTDKIDAGTLASLHAAGFLPEVCTPPMRQPSGCGGWWRWRNQVVRHRTRLKNAVHLILHAHCVPRCPHADLFNRAGGAWLARQVLPEDERQAFVRHVREFDRPAEDLTDLNRLIGEATIDSVGVPSRLRQSGLAEASLMSFSSWSRVPAGL